MNRSEPVKGKEENREVTELLAALPRVEAPSNFDFGVKARIAGGGSKRRLPLFPFLKVAAPLSLLLVVGGFAFFYGTMADENAGVAKVDAPQYYAPEPAPRAIPDGAASPTEPPAPIPEPKVSAPARDVAAASNRSRRASAVSRSTNATTSAPGGGSFVTSLSDANVIQAPGTKTTSNVAEVGVREFLGVIGMNVDVVAGKWTVLSTSENSVAKRSGVMTNDIVESINDQPLAGKEKFNGKIDARSLTVSRGGKSIKLDLKH